MDSLFEQNAPQPLAERLRPTSLDEVVGQTHLLGGDGLIRQVVDGGSVPSLILWGPPGTGKTTLARIIAKSSGSTFIELSAVAAGLADIKKVVTGAEQTRALGRQTILFIDEIHRFNKAQQDALLPHVEKGTITLIGATTENPSFEVVSALLSRSRVVTLQSLTKEDLEGLLRRGVALLDGVKASDGALRLLAQMAAGDARVALGGLEVAASLTREITEDTVQQALQKTALRYDKGGEYHYNLVSAFIKSMRASDPDAAVFYMARMLEAGEDPKFIARRMVVFASEDVGLADPHALPLALAGFQSVERIGLPEAAINLSHVAVALSVAPKSRSSYSALRLAQKAVKEHPSAEVPLHLRNAPNGLMKRLGYGEGTKWEPGFRHPKGCLPDELSGQTYYHRHQNDHPSPSAS